MNNDYTMALTKVAASIVTECFGRSLASDTYYSDDGNSVILEFDGYPLYGSSETGKVFVRFPRSTFYVRRGNVHYEPLQQAECRFYQESLGNQFAHPHIYHDGHPCWDNSKRERPVDFITNIIETLSLQNVSKDSVLVGLCASGVMGIRMEALENARTQQKKVTDNLKCKPFISDHRKLESYVSKRWSSKITMLMNAA